MADITLDETTLYYQYLINNNPTSTMLNAISGNYSNSGFDILGSLGSLGALGTGTTSPFASILQSYMSGINSNSYEDSIEMATMADKLSSVLEEAAKEEDTSSLTYKTVQELYEYFSEQVSAKASALMGKTTSSAGITSTDATTTNQMSTLEQMNQAALQGQEFDFSQIDKIMDTAFAEVTPWS